MTMTEKPLIYFATPCYGGQVYAPMASSIVHLFDKLRMAEETQGWGFSWSNWSSDSLIPRGRNAMVADMMCRRVLDPATKGERPYTHLMFIDADIVFDPDSVYSLVAADKPVAAGVYPKKVLPERYVINVDMAREQPLENGLAKVRDTGTGFMLIKREVFEALKPTVAPRSVVRDILQMVRDDASIDLDAAANDIFDGLENSVHKLAPTIRWSQSEFLNPEHADYKAAFASEYFSYFDTQIEAHGGFWADYGMEYLSEDYAFCRRVQRAGMDVWFSPFIDLDHIGSYRFEGKISKQFIPLAPGEPVPAIAAE